MLTTNPFSELANWIPVIAIQVYVIVMVLLVVAGTLIDVVRPILLRGRGKGEAGAYPGSPWR